MASSNIKLSLPSIGSVPNRPLTTTFGDTLNGGWCSWAIRTVSFDKITLELEITKGSATKFYLKVQSASEGDLSEDRWADFMRADGSGALVPDIMEIPLANLTTGQRIAITIDCAGVPLMRFALRADSITGAPAADAQFSVHHEGDAGTLIENRFLLDPSA